MQNGFNSMLKTFQSKNFVNIKNKQQLFRGEKFLDFLKNNNQQVIFGSVHILFSRNKHAKTKEKKWSPNVKFSIGTRNFYAFPFQLEKESGATNPNYRSMCWNTCDTLEQETDSNTQLTFLP